MGNEDQQQQESALGAIMTPLAQAVAGQHELYREYVRAGFSRREALELVKTVIVTSIRPCGCAS